MAALPYRRPTIRVFMVVNHHVMWCHICQGNEIIEVWTNWCKLTFWVPWLRYDGRIISLNIHTEVLHHWVTLCSKFAWIIVSLHNFNLIWVRQVAVIDFIFMTDHWIPLFNHWWMGPISPKAFHVNAAKVIRFHTLWPWNNCELCMGNDNIPFFTCKILK